MVVAKRKYRNTLVVYIACLSVLEYYVKRMILVVQDDQNETGYLYNLQTRTDTRVFKRETFPNFYGISKYIVQILKKSPPFTNKSALTLSFLTRTTYFFTMFSDLYNILRIFYFWVVFFLNLLFKNVKFGTFLGGDFLYLPLLDQVKNVIRYTLNGEHFLLFYGISKYIIDILKSHCHFPISQS